jgi:hypothetical protein
MFQFVICPVLSQDPIGELDISNVEFTESVDGPGTLFTGEAYITDTQDAEKLKNLLNYPGDPQAVALYVKFEDRYLWGGVLKSRPWDRTKKAFILTATSWKAWMYQRFLDPNMNNNPVTDFKFSWTATEQFDIARDILDWAVSDDGTPTIWTGIETSGVMRDLTIFGSEFVYSGDAIDRMANREKGFEWDITPRTDSLGRPELWLGLFYPKRVAVNSGVLIKGTPDGGNIIDSTNPEDTAETVVTRVWGTGSGTSGADLLMAFDEDPNLAGGDILLIETKEYSNSSTIDTATIASHVQGIRKFHSTGLQQIEVTCLLTDPDWQLYNIGDKIRLIVQDDVMDIDYESVRIVRRTFKVNSNPADFDVVTLLIDLNDTALPQDDEAI